MTEQSVKIIIQDLQTSDGFRNWLAQLPQEEEIGHRCQMNACPIANYLKNKYAIARPKITACIMLFEEEGFDREGNPIEIIIFPEN